MSAQFEVCALADSVTGCAVHTTLEAGVGYSSIDITVSYLRHQSNVHHLSIRKASAEEASAMTRAVNDPEMSDRQGDGKRMVHRYSALGEFVQRLRSPRSLALLIAAVGGLALATPTAAFASSGHHHAPQRDLRLNQVNLASDIPGMAR